MTYSKNLINGNSTIGFNKIKFEPANPETGQDYLTFLYDKKNNLIAVITTNDKPKIKLDWKTEYKTLNKINCFFKMV